MHHCISRPRGDLPCGQHQPARCRGLVHRAAQQLHRHPAQPREHDHRRREAAALDGATSWRTYRDIIIPLLKPITISTLIILGHISLKIFELIFAMSGKGPGFATDVPGIFVYEQTFSATRYNLGAAASIVMLIMVSLVMIPYLIQSMKDVEQ